MLVWDLFTFMSFPPPPLPALRKKTKERKKEKAKGKQEKYGCFAFCYYVEIVIKSLQVGRVDSTNFFNLACFVVALIAESM